MSEMECDRRVTVEKTLAVRIAAAEAALRRGATAEARQMLAHCHDTRARILVGISYLREGQHQQATEVLATTVADSPDNGLAHAYYSLALVISGHVGTAQAALDRAVALEPASFAVRLIAAQFAYRLGFYPEAVRRLNAALALGAPDPESYVLASALLREARERARGNFERRIGVIRLTRLVEWSRRVVDGTRRFFVGAVRLEAH